MKRMTWGRAGGWGLLVSVLVWGGGCSQEPGDTSGGGGTESGSSGNPITAPVDYLGAVANSQKSATKTTSLVGVQQAIKMFQAQEGRFPKDLNELVGPDYLPRLPEVPRGMKFDYDARTGEIKVVPQ